MTSRLGAFLRAAVVLAPFLLPAGSAASDAGIPRHKAAPVDSFLDSIGVVSSFPDRGQPLEKTVAMVRYGGFRWVRAGIEGLTSSGPTTLKTFIDLHHATGAKLAWGLVSGGSDLTKLLETGRALAKAGALLAFEGNNEPNNWTVTYKGQEGGGKMSWLPVAELQRDLYRAVKTDPLLASYPVWTISEPGAQRNNAGLQFLTIPPGVRTLMPPGTAFADFANVHNYIYHPNSPDPADNKTWDAADPTSSSKVDGLYGNFGVTWLRGFRGYSDGELEVLPRVTTETGALIEGEVTEELHALNLLTIYLAQFKRGYSHTSVYILRDRTDEDGNQAFGFFRPDYRPRLAAQYLHNLTTILGRAAGKRDAGGELDYLIRNQPDTVHDLLLAGKDGGYQLVVWGERLHGEDRITIDLGQIRASVSVFDPTIGADPIRTVATVRELPLTLSNHPLVLSILP
jgi:hypothetical protein